MPGLFLLFVSSFQVLLYSTELQTNVIIIYFFNKITQCAGYVFKIVKVEKVAHCFGIITCSQ